jgi:hypothetical protein
MKRCLLLAVALTVLSPPSITLACNCQATREQRWLAYKAYKERIALERERLLAKQQRQIDARPKQVSKDSGRQ